MAKNYTRFTNVEIVEELKVGSVVVDGVDDITPPAKAAGSSYTKAEIDAIVDAVNGLLALQGQTGD